MRREANRAVTRTHFNLQTDYTSLSFTSIDVGALIGSIALTVFDRYFPHWSTSNFVALSLSFNGALFLWKLKRITERKLVQSYQPIALGLLLDGRICLVPLRVKELMRRMSAGVRAAVRPVPVRYLVRGGTTSQVNKLIQLASLQVGVRDKCDGVSRP